MTRLPRFGRTILACLLLTLALTGILPTPAVAANVVNERWCPPETGYCAENAFYAFWRANGGLEILGYPIDHPRRRPDGLIVQYYERAIMEWHPENGPDYQVLLTRLGATLVEDQHQKQQPPIPCTTSCSLVSQTNHTLRGSFLRYWTNYGALPVYGFPLTEEYEERNASDGRFYTVQYFERNRFEYHPENAGTRYEVLLGRLGVEAFASRASEIREWAVVRTPNYASTRHAAIVTTATVLVESVADMRYISDTLAAHQVSWVFDGTLPRDVTGAYSFRTNTILYNPALLILDPHALGVVLGHEGQHAYDYLTYGAPRTPSECYAFEFRGFLAEAALWAAWWGPRGKPDPTNDFEYAENALLDDILYNEGRETRRFITTAYAEECNRRDPAMMDDELERHGVLTTTEGLPRQVRALFLDADAQLSALTENPLPTAAESQGAPVDWVKR